MCSKLRGSSVVGLGMEENKYAGPFDMGTQGRSRGMTLRAWIAGQAAAALDAADWAHYGEETPGQRPGWQEAIAKRAVALADAVIEELGRE